MSNSFFETFARSFQKIMIFTFKACTFRPQLSVLSYEAKILDITQLSNSHKIFIILETLERIELNIDIVQPLILIKPRILTP